MKPCSMFFFLERLTLWEARVKLCVARALRWRCEWPEESRAYLKDARIYGHFLRNGLATAAEFLLRDSAWLAKRNQSALEVML